MKRVLMLMMAVWVGAALGARAEAEASATLDVASAYIFRGLTAVDDVVVQPGLNGVFYGVTAGTWANFNTDSSQFDEIDYFASYDLPLEAVLGEEPVLGLSVGYTEYTYPTAVDDAGAGLEADREVSLSASLKAPLSPKATVAYGLEGPYLDESVYIELGLSHEYAVDDNVKISGGATLGIEAGDNVANTGVSHLRLSAGASVGPVALGVNWVIETDEDVLAVDRDFYGTLGISLPL